MAGDAFVWLKQAEKDLQAARKSFEDEDYGLSTQQARNSAERSLQAAWIVMTGQEAEETHSVSKLARMVGLDDLLEEFDDAPPASPDPRKAAALRSLQIAGRIMAEVRPKFE